VASGADPGDRPPGWALTGGRKRNVAIAAAAPIDPELGGRGERFTPQTAEEAARLAEYNRYLAELAAEDAAEASS
jgi:energy-coupling factor transporter ATP-binding protein EcfA2